MSRRVVLDTGFGPGLGLLMMLSAMNKSTPAKTRLIGVDELAEPKPKPLRKFTDARKAEKARRKHK